MGLEVPLDTELKCHSARRTADARPVEAYFNHSIRRDADQFDIAAIGLHGGSDKTNDLGDALSNGVGSWGNAGAQPFILGV